MANPVNLFISYSHDDFDSLTKLTKYVNKEMCPDLQVWDDKSLAPGAVWDNEIKRKLKSADIILLLVSQSFLESVYINEVELKEALRRAKNDQCVLIPVFAKTCPLTKPLAKEIAAFQGFPRSNAKKQNFLNQTQDDIYTHLTEIYNGVIETVENVKRKKLEVSSPSQNNKIFLALPGSERGLNMRNRFFYEAKDKQEYDNWPFDIIPDAGLFQSMGQINSAPLASAQQMMDASVYTIHTIAEATEINEGLVKAQLDHISAGTNNNKFSKSILWARTEEVAALLPPELKQSHSVVAGKEMDKIFEVIEDLEKERKEQLESEVKLPGYKVIMVYDYPKDHKNKLRAKIKTGIEKRKVCSIRLNTPYATVEDIKNAVGKCQGAIIFYGSADREWYLFRQDLLYETLLKCKAVGIAKPRIQDKIDNEISQGEFDILFQDDKNLQANIDLFINRLSA